MLASGNGSGQATPLTAVLILLFVLLQKIYWQIRWFNTIKTQIVSGLAEIRTINWWRYQKYNTIIYYDYPTLVLNNDNNRGSVDWTDRLRMQTNK